MGVLPANLRPDLDALRVDVAIANLRDVVKDGWSVLGLSTGMVDALTDQTGIASLGGATYDGAAKTVSNPGGYTANLCSGGTAICSTYWNATYQPSNAFDGNNSTVWQPGSGEVGAGMNNVSFIGYQFASSRVIRQIVVNQDPTGAVSQVQVQAYISGSWTNIGSASSVGSGANTISVPANVGSTQWRVLCTNNGSISYWNIREISMAEAAASAAVTVTSNAFALGFQPVQARIIAPMEIGSGVVGTNGLLDLSRDGSTWAAVPLSDLGKFDSNTRIIGGLVNLSGQPAGSSIYWRWRTTAGIAQALHGVWIQCK
ncbi:discoidin domain-containing protein [Magnetospirillum sp. ME-1]|uniref:discoidin domain-containing protein n=1 Tax=Magnetospirillum sp. ME-1 TaxID=1639348 RepID=UPI000A195D40|nr:discoidin domain-containing protein [Magnetospirillum sp. ME-1]